MNKIKELLPKIKYELSLFAALSVNFLLFFTKETLMSDGMYPMHLVDVRAGFISRTLAGSINGLLYGNPTKAETAVTHTVVTLLTFWLVAVFLGRCIKKAETKSGKSLFIISLIVAVLPYGFMTFVNLFELLDIYWVLAAVLCLLSADNKKTALLIPIFIVLGGWAHYTFVLAFMPVIYIMFLSLVLKKKSRFYYALTAVMIIVSVSSTIYFFTTSRTFNVISFDEFTQYILDKAGDRVTQFEVYCGEAFRPYDEINYDYYIEKYGLPEWTRNASDLTRAFYGYFAFAFIDGSIKGMVADLVLCAPLAAFFAVLWKKSMKKAEDKGESFTYLLCLITPLVQLFACFTSSDTSRWLSLMIISQLFLTALLIKENKKPVSDSLEELFGHIERFKGAVVCVLLFYLSLVFVW